MSTLYPVLTDNSTRLITGDPQAALNLKANLASPTFTGVPLSTTAAGGTNTTQIATTAFVSAAVSLAVTGLLELKGSLDCSTNPNYPAGSVGDAYLVTVAGKIGGSSGLNVDIGDTIICQTDNAGGTQASVGASWFVLEHNLAGALMSANNLSDVASNATARTNLGLGTLATQSGTFSGTSSGTNTGDVTLAGETYLSLSAQAITAAAVNLSGTQVTGTLAAGRFPALTGDVTNTVGAVATTIANSAVSLAKMANMATASVFYRKTAGTGAPEVNTLATLKTDLGLTGTNSGDQTISLTGDVTGSGTGSFATTLATVATAGTTGGSTAIPVVTINAKGLTTGITTAAVIAPAGTLTGATLASNVLASSLTSVGTLAAVAITGGTINGATVGATTPATGAFTSLSSTIGANFATSSGNVGIGNSSPLFKLTVGTGTINAVNALHNVVVTNATDARIGVYVNNIGVSLRTEGTYASLFTYDYTNNIGKTLALCEYGGNVGIGTTSPGAQLQVSSGAAGTIGEIIKGAASQTANLTEWQNSSATVLACVTAAGNVGIGTSSPNANAILDVSSTTKAFMPPRMTTTQKNAIASPTSGMVVYDSTLNKLCVRAASAWETVTSV